MAEAMEEAKRLWGEARRWPDIESPQLRAWDATDELLLEAGLREVSDRGLEGSHVLVVDDRYGALTLGLSSAGLHHFTVVQDSATLTRALKANADDAGIHSFALTSATTLAELIPRNIELVLWQLPRSVGEVAYEAASMAPLLAEDAVVLAGGRDKHMSPSMNTPLARWIGPVQPQRGSKKSRVLRVDRDVTHAPVVASEIEAACSLKARPVTVAGTSITVCGDARVFGGDRLDSGTKLLLETLAQTLIIPAPGEGVVDLGCGNGTIAAWAARTWPHTYVEATDSSAAAITATQASAEASRVSECVRAVRSDAGQHLLPMETPDDQAARASSLDVCSTRLVLMNPPFHQGAVVERSVGEKLFFAAREIAGAGGRVVAVWNSHLRYRPFLREHIGHTRELGRDRTFTVTETIIRE